MTLIYTDLIGLGGQAISQSFAVIADIARDRETKPPMATEIKQKIGHRQECLCHKDRRNRRKIEKAKAYR